MEETDHEGKDDLDFILNELEPEHIPPEFIQAARVTDLDYQVRIITSEELEEIMDNAAKLEDMGILSIQVILDIDAIKIMVNKYSEIILRSVPI